MKIEGKNYAAIAATAVNNVQDANELKILVRLTNALNNVRESDPEIRDSNAFITVTPTHGQFSHSDLTVTLYNAESRTLVGEQRIETEIGEKQVYWTNKIPWSQWKRGLSLVDRKYLNYKDKQAFDYFLKYSKSLESFFFVDMKRADEKQAFSAPAKANHSLGFVTNNVFYAISKDDAILENGVLYDDESAMARYIYKSMIETYKDQLEPKVTA